MGAVAEAVPGLTFEEYHAKHAAGLFDKDGGLLRGHAYGVEALREAGHGADELLVAGGATRSHTWLQMHADVTGLPVGWCI